MARWRRRCQAGLGAIRVRAATSSKPGTARGGAGSWNQAVLGTPPAGTPACGSMDRQADGAPLTCRTNRAMISGRQQGRPTGILLTGVNEVTAGSIIKAIARSARPSRHFNRPPAPHSLASQIKRPARPGRAEHPNSTEAVVAGQRNGQPAPELNSLTDPRQRQPVAAQASHRLTREHQQPARALQEGQRGSATDPPLMM